MKKVWNCLLFALLSAIMAGCGKAADNISAEGSFCLISEEGAALNLEDFWKTEEEGENTVKFATGLEVVFPEEWRENIVFETESDSNSFNRLSVCEKENADAGIGGDLFYLCLTERTQGMIVLSDWSRVFGLYNQGGREYVLVQDRPGDRCYSEDDQSLIDAYQALSGTINNVIIKTDHMQGFTECGIEDLDWVQYESETVYDPPRMNIVDLQALPSEESDMTPDSGENLWADALEIKSLAEEILKAYYSGDIDAVQRLLPETYDWDIDVYGGTGTISDIAFKGLPETGEQPEGTVLAVSVEHRNSDFDDMLVYLTVELIKQNGRWEIQFYGLEG